MSLLCVHNLNIAFKNNQKNSEKSHLHEAVRAMSFSLDAGETLALVGESGSGKSLTALACLGLLPSSATRTGEIFFHPPQLLSVLPSTPKGHAIHALKENALQHVRGVHISMIFQEPMTALNPLHSVERHITEPLMVHEKLTILQARTRALELLKMVDFKGGSERFHAYPHQLSGGQRQRVMIAAALACSPRILIADEPTTALDVTTQHSIVSLLKKLQEELKMALILISHDLPMVASFGQNGAPAHIMVMRQGVTVEQGLMHKVLQEPKHPYTQKLIQAVPKGHPAPLLENAPTVLSASNMQVVFGKKPRFLSPKDTRVHAVKDLSFCLKEGETLGIVGESGSGKSTLIYSILRLLDVPFKGEVTYLDRAIHNISSKAMRHLRGHMQIVFQDPFASLNPRFSAAQIVAEGLHVHAPTLTPLERTQKVMQAFKDVGLDETHCNRYPHEFSGGQRQRLAIARALILDPKIIMLDEPTSALDRSVQAEILALLKTLQRTKSLSFIFVSHDLHVVRSMSHRILVMKDGACVEEGVTEKIFKQPSHPYTQNLVASCF